MQFEFATAASVRFGSGVVREVPAAAARMGQRAMLVTGKSPERAKNLAGEIVATGVSLTPFQVDGEPTIALIEKAVALARAERCDMVIAFGGGSALDAGKVVAAMLANPGELLDYLEGIGRGKDIAHPSVPFIAIPTTAGTGSEVTRNGVLGSPEHGLKVSVRSAFLLPRLAVVDPDLTLDLPRGLTVSTGLDALTQLIEPYVCLNPNPMTDLIAMDGLRNAVEALPRVWADGQDREARRKMAWASLMGGMALANSGLGAVHGFAVPLGGTYGGPHGALCAAMLPHVMRINVRALRSRAPEHPALPRYSEVARVLTGRPHASAEDGVEWIADLCRRFEIPALAAYGVTKADLPAVAEKAAKARSMKANPIVLTGGELSEIAERAL
jgi:alcohol dehydrogenase class IV